MINRKVSPTDRAGRLARLEADNARLRKAARDIEADLGGLRAALGMRRRRHPAVDPAYRLLLISGGERRAGEA
jgi:hypothetical protein